MNASRRRRAALIALAGLPLAGLPLSPLAAQRAPAGHQPGEVAAVLRAMDRYLATIAARDLRAMEALQTPDGMTYRAHRAGGDWQVESRPNLAWVAPSQNDGRRYRERYWEPTVLVRGAIAVVWAPYEFWEDGKTSHCGVDVFSFVKGEGGWRVANSMWTVEPDACAELRPRDPATMRPED